MNTKTMTIHEALAELKMLDNRIEDKIMSTNFIVANKVSNKKIGSKNIDEYIQKANEAYQSINDLLKYRFALRNAVSQSNASTKIIIGGVEYTVSQAIEMRKTGIVLKQDLLQTLQSQRDSAFNAVEKNNQRVDASADEYIKNVFANIDKASPDTLAIRQTYIDNNKYDVVSMNNFDERFSTLFDEIQSFTSQVDSAISVSNALTTITIEY